MPAFGREESSYTIYHNVAIAGRVSVLVKLDALTTVIQYI
jgi:hypothetical protein